MAFHTLVRPAAVGLCLALATATPAADEKNMAAPLTPADIAAGWVKLFDEESAFGWTLPDGAKVENGILKLPAGKPYVVSPKLVLGVPFDLHVEYEGAITIHAGRSRVERQKSAFGTRRTEVIRLIQNPTGSFPTVESGGSGRSEHDVTPRKELADTAILIETEGKEDAFIHAVRVRPVGLTQLLNGKDLTGWKRYTGDPKREKSTFTVAGGELSVKNGPGDLQTERQFADFVLQLECKSNGVGLNSGVFFRGIPGQYQQGYEAQIQNAIVGGDRTKPLDFGTGAIYRRIPARKVMADDKEWFTMTLIAKGSRITTWVNGYPTVNWVDERKPADNGRNGLKTGPGVLSIQGHDPTTDLAFRNIRIVEIR
jgi:cold shock CspA family protein